MSKLEQAGESNTTSPGAALDCGALHGCFQARAALRFAKSPISAAMLIRGFSNQDQVFHAIPHQVAKKAVIASFIFASQ